MTEPTNYQDVLIAILAEAIRGEASFANIDPVTFTDLNFKLSDGVVIGIEAGGVSSTN